MSAASGIQECMDEPTRSRPAPRLQTPERDQMKFRVANLDELAEFLFSDASEQ